MADAYRGLTIRIGGDTSKLTAALRSANRAAQQTQTQLRAVTKAMRFDPQSINSVSLKLRLMEERSESLASQLKTTATAYRQLGSSRTDGMTKSVRELSEQTGNAALAAQRALERYNSVDAQLERMYASINKAARANEEFGDSFDLREADDIERAAQDLVEMGVIAQDTADELRFLRSVWQDAFNGNEAAKQVQTFRELEVKANGLQSEIAALSREMTDLKVPSKLSTQFDESRAAVERIDRSIKDLEADIKRCDSALRFDPGNMDAARRKMEDLATASQLAERKAELLGQRIKSYDESNVASIASGMESVSVEAQEAAAAYAEVSARLSAAKGELEELRAAQQRVSDSVEATSSDYEEVAAAVSRAEAEVGQLEAAERAANERRDNAAMASEYRELTGQIAQAKAQAAGFTSQIGQSGQASAFTLSNIKSLGMTLSATLTPNLVMAGQYGVDSAVAIDAAYRDMRKTVQGTETDFENLKQSALEFSSQNVTSAEQILQIQAIGGELGIATENLEVFSETVSNLDIATNLNAEDAATALGTLSNILNDLDATSMPRFADALVRLGNNGASTETQIADIAKRIGSMGSIVGMSTPDILAWASTIASTGQNAEAAGTAISKTMSNIETAVAKGGESLEAFADISGMSAQEFADTWNSDPTAALKAFIEGLRGIEEGGGSADKALQDLGINAVRQKQAIEGLMQSIGGLDDNLQMSNNAWNGITDQWGAAGDAAREAQAKNEGLAGSLQRLKNIASNFASEIGDAVAPVISDVADAATDLFEAFSDMDDGFKRAVAGAAVFAAGLGPVLSIGSSVGTALGKLKGHIDTGRTAWAKMSKAAGTAKTALGATSKTVSVASAAVDGLTVAQKLAAGGSKLLAAGLGVLKGGAVGLAVAGIGYVVANLERQRQHQELVNDATMSAAEIMSQSAATAVLMGDSLSSIEPDVDGVLQSMKELNQEASKLLTETFTQTSTLDRHVATINELANKSNLTATQQERLKQAVAGYNEITGQSVSVVDAANGKLQDQNGELLENIDRINESAEAWKNRAKQEAYSKMAGKYIEEQVKAEHELRLANDGMAESQEKCNEAVEAWRKANSDGDFFGKAAASKQFTDAKAEMAGYSDQIEELAASYSTARDSANRFAVEGVLSTSGLSQSVQDNIRGLTPAWQMFATDIAMSLQASGESVGTFEENLAAMGIDFQSVKDIGAENFALLYEACSGNLDMMKWCIENYNTVPIINKDGTVNVNDASLIDAQGNVWTWNGETFVDKHNQVITDDIQLRDAQGRLYVWNGSELIDKGATADLASESVKDAQEAMDKANSTELEDHDATTEIDSESVKTDIDRVAKRAENPPEDQHASTTIDHYENYHRRYYTERHESGRPIGGNIPRAASMVASLAPSAGPVPLAASLLASPANAAAIAARSASAAAFDRYAGGVSSRMGNPVSVSNNDNSRHITYNVTIGGEEVDATPSIKHYFELLMDAVDTARRRG